jgi:ribosomal RNA-processing protein 12
MKYTPEEDRKLLINIRKTRERKKRGKELTVEEVEEDTAKVPQSQYGTNF